MRQRVIQTYQGHYVPQQAYRPGPLFDVSVLRQEPVVTDYEQTPEGEAAFPPGATALNGMAGVKYFRCTYCGTVLPENETYGHDCGGDDGEG